MPRANWPPRLGEPDPETSAFDTLTVRSLAVQIADKRVHPYGNGPNRDPRMPEMFAVAATVERYLTTGNPLGDEPQDDAPALDRLELDLVANQLAQAADLLTRGRLNNPDTSDVADSNRRRWADARDELVKQLGASVTSLRQQLAARPSS